MVEDDATIRYLVSEYFRRVGYEVLEAPDGEIGYRAGLEKKADVIILDVMMPKMDGFEVCRNLRQQNVHTPIIFLTHKDDERHTVTGLESGADDYLPKPFSPRELEARVKSVMRRCGIVRAKTLHPAGSFAAGWRWIVTHMLSRSTSRRWR